ncbi:secretion protein HlyD [Desulfovibrionales bacterium]
MRRVMLLGIVLILGTSAWLFWKTSQTTTSEKRTFHGNVDIREVRLGFRVAGRVLDVCKEEGDTVAAGEVLARLENEPYTEAVHQATAQVRQLEARLVELKNGPRPQEIDQAEKNLAQAQAQLNDARLRHDRLRQLITSGATAQQDYDSSLAAFEAAKARRDAVQATLDLVRAGTRHEQIIQAEATLDAARAGLEQARIHLADTELVAPEPGILLTRVVEPGSLVQAGSTALTLSLMAPVRVRAYAPEPELGKIHPGQQVLVYTDSRPTPYHGQIGDISPRAEFTPKSVETQDLRTALVYRFRIVITDADTMLRQGMPVTVYLDGEN